MMVAFVVLAITLGSLLAAGLPLITALIGVGIGVTGLTALSGVDRPVGDRADRWPRCSASRSASTTRCSSSRATARTSATAWTSRESAAQATATAGSAVVFAGLTVVIALVGLTVVNIPFLTVMGLAAAGTVAIAVLIAITLLPAILGFAGDRIDARQPRARLPAGRARAHARDDASVRWARFVTRRPLAGAARRPRAARRVALPALHMKLGLPDGGSQPTVDDRAPLLRPADRGLRPRLQRPADRGRRRARSSTRPSRSRSPTPWPKGLEGIPGVAAVSPPCTNERAT